MPITIQGKSLAVSEIGDVKTLPFSLPIRAPEPAMTGTSFVSERANLQEAQTHL